LKPATAAPKQVNKKLSPITAKVPEIATPAKRNELRIVPLQFDILREREEVGSRKTEVGKPPVTFAKLL
jgi:hypothetical protein